MYVMVSRRCEGQHAKGRILLRLLSKMRRASETRTSEPLTNLAAKRKTFLAGILESDNCVIMLPPG